MAECIERESLINNRPEGRNPFAMRKEEYNRGWNDCRSAFYECIMAEPAADVAPVVHGRWETISDPEYVMKDFSCSECEELICDFDTTVLWPGQNCYYYCPNCGARMDLEDKP